MRAMPDTSRFEAIDHLTSDELRQRLRSLQALIASAPVPIAIAHDPDCRFISANLALATLLGVPLGRNISMTPADGSPPPYRIQRNGKDLPENELPMQLAIAHRASISNDIEILRSDGTVAYVQNDVEPLYDTHGEVYGCVSVCVDLTEQKLAQLALIEADRRKDEFLATLSHELRNPLAPLRSALEVMRLARDKPDVVERARQTMERQLMQLIRLTDDLLDVARITQGKLEMRRERIDLRAVLHAAVDAARPAIEGQGHSVQLDLPDVPLWADADPTRLVQVFSNLLNNAVKYTARGGHIRVNAAAAGADVILRVQDDGVGIPDGMLPHIFDMFTQFPGHRDRSHGGLGIGLTLARRLVERHGGTIEAKSEGPGRGSVFTVTLPAAVDAAAVGRAPAGRSRYSSPRVPHSRRRGQPRRARDAAADALALRPRRHRRLGRCGGGRSCDRHPPADRLPRHRHAAHGRLRGRPEDPRSARVVGRAGGAHRLGAGRRQAPFARGWLQSPPDETTGSGGARGVDRRVRSAHEGRGELMEVGGVSLS